MCPDAMGSVTVPAPAEGPVTWSYVVFARGYAFACRRRGQSDEADMVDHLCDLLADVLADRGEHPQPVRGMPLTRAEIVRARARVAATGNVNDWLGVSPA